jgi:hypothetical protein
MIDPDKIYQAIIDAAREWTQDDQEARRLAKLEKIVLAEITNNQDQALSHAVRLSLALAAPEYRLHVTNMVTAKTKANMSHARYKAAQSLAELRRSQESTRRAEAQIR